MVALDMSFILPYPNSPQNGDSGDADPIRSNFQAIAQGIQSFDGAQIQAATIQEAALAANINPRLRASETISNFVYTGCVWTAASGLNGSMSGGTAYINGYRVTVNAIGNKTFTASRDTYIAVDYLGNVSYHEVANNAAAPSLPANSTWLAIVITGGSTITAVDDISIRNGTSGIIARRVLGSARDTITISGIPPKQHLNMILAVIPSGTINTRMTFNNDNAANYAQLFNASGTYAPLTTQAYIELESGVGSRVEYAMFSVMNVASRVKLGYQHLVHDGGTSSAATAPEFFDNRFKWANTTTQITRVDVSNNEAGDFAAGSELLVFSRD